MIGWWFMHLLHAYTYVESADVKIVLGTLNVVPDWMLLKIWETYSDESPTFNLCTKSFKILMIYTIYIDTNIQHNHVS